MKNIKKFKKECTRLFTGRNIENVRYVRDLALAGIKKGDDKIISMSAALEVIKAL